MRRLKLAYIRAISCWVLLLPLALILHVNTSMAQGFPSAADDRYSMLVDCNCNVLTGNLLDNDFCGGTGNIEVAYVVAPKLGLFSCGPKGNFVYCVEDRFSGILEFRYRIQNIDDKSLFADASVYITISNDSDCDSIPDERDLDSDNDGILDQHEGYGDIDTDMDGIPDCFDIDSDNDGITDLDEWQREDYRIPRSFKDENKDGWDDAFDSNYGGDYYEPVDTDMDGIPDYLDSDSDNDLLSDLYEASDPLFRLSEYDLTGIDSDHDGMDDLFDTVSCCSYQANTIVSSQVLADSDHNHKRDWRDAKLSENPKDSLDAKTPDDQAIVYPNPVSDMCYIVLNHPNELPHQQCNLSLFTTAGTLVLSKVKSGLNFQIDLTMLPQGQYYLRVRTRLNTYYRKIIKN